jgi:8-oxo-dGTP diphosphatase
MPRNRAVALVVNNGQLLVMFRKNKREFYTFPGGGIEPDETNGQAAVREIKEEASLDIEVKKLVYEIHYDNGEINYYFLSDYKSGTPQVMSGTDEYQDNLRGSNLYMPQWQPIKDLSSLELYPIELRDKLLHDLNKGFSDQPVVFNLPNWQ